MPFSVHIPSSDQKNLIREAVDILDEIFQGAGNIVTLISQGGQPERGQLRYRLVQLIDGSGVEDASSEEIKKKFGRATLPKLRHMRLNRLPVICVGTDDQETRFEDDDRFASTDRLPLVAAHGPITLRIEVVYNGEYHLAMSKTLLWEQDSHTHIAVQALGALLGSGVQLMGDQSTSEVGSEALQRATMERLGNSDVNGLHIQQVMCTSACSPTNTVLDRVRGPLQSGQCLTLRIRGVISVEGVTQGLAVEIEQPLSVTGTRVVGVRPRRPILPWVFIAQFRNIESHALWVLTQYIHDHSYNIFWNGSSAKIGHQKVEGDEAIQNVIETTLIQTLGFAASEILYIFADHGAHRVHHLRPFLLAIIGQERPDLRSAQNLLDRIRAQLPEQDTSVFTSKMKLGVIRSGSWDPSIDGPALERAIYMVARVCKVFPLEVSRLIQDGAGSLGPVTLNLSHLGQVQRVQRYDPKMWFILGVFGIFSRRSEPWEIRTGNSGAAHYTNLRQMVLSNLNSIDVNDPIDYDQEESDHMWRNPARLRRCAAMLNEVAALSSFPMPALAIATNSWDHWRKLLDGSTRRSLLSAAQRSSLDELLRKAWRINYPSKPIVPKYLINRIKIMVNSLVLKRFEAKATEGVVLYAAPESFYKIALACLMFKRNPDDPTATQPWTATELDFVHEKAVPFVNRTWVALMMWRNADQIKAIHDRIVDDCHARGQTIPDLFEGHVSAEIHQRIADLYS